MNFLKKRFWIRNRKRMEKLNGLLFEIFPTSVHGKLKKHLSLYRRKLSNIMEDETINLSMLQNLIWIYPDNESLNALDNPKEKLRGFWILIKCGEKPLELRKILEETFPPHLYEKALMNFYIIMPIIEELKRIKKDGNEIFQIDSFKLISEYPQKNQRVFSLSYRYCEQRSKEVLQGTTNTLICICEESILWDTSDTIPAIHELITQLNMAL